MVHNWATVSTDIHSYFFHFCFVTGRNWKYWKIPLHSLSRDQRINLIRDPVLTMEIETAAYTLLALVEAGRLQQAGGVASWLTSQHRSNGRFIATQVSLWLLGDYWVFVIDNMRK